MKKLLFIGILFLLSSCTTVRWKMGMDESEFKEQSHQIKMVKMSATGNIYYFQSADGIVYFYFKNGKLLQVDHGVRSPDVVIQNQ